MRKLTVLFAAVALTLGLSSAATAATVQLTSGTLGITLSALPPITVSANPGSTPIYVSSGFGSFTEPSGVFGPATIPLARTLFTGVPQISGLTLAGFGNGTKVVNCGGAGCTGTGGLVGSSIVNVLQLLNLSIPINVVGVAGASVQAKAGSIIITVIGQGWTTGTATVTAVTTTLPGTTVTTKVTLAGSDARTAGHGGTITLVSGFQAITNVAGSLPGFGIQTLNFAGVPPVPEPGTLLLIGSGVAGLVVLGRRRMKK